MTQTQQQQTEKPPARHPAGTATLETLRRLFMTPARRRALDAAVAASTPGGTGARLTSLAGSSPAMVLPDVAPKGRLVVVGADMDDAGYLYHDLCRTMGERAVAVFPSGYKRSIRYGQPDPPQQILRSETLGRVATGDRALRVVVTCPEALAERVATPERVAQAMLSLSTSTPVHPDDVIMWLRDNGFREVDYVYEPGTFAVRGSIMDIFSFSNELPYRLDFFGEDIDSIRTFDVQTQLSEQRMDTADIAANVSRDEQDGSSGGAMSLLQFMDPGAGDVLCVRDSLGAVLGAVAQLAGQGVSASSLISGDGDPCAMDQLMTPEDLRADAAAWPVVAFTASADPRDTAQDAPQAVMDFSCSPQGLYHKNFDLISQTLAGLLSDGYGLYILSDSPKQLERLRAIFDDRHDDIPFTGVDATLHAGYVDHARRTVVFTDHQIFDRFHKYSLAAADRARAGRMALSLKELNALEVGDYVVHLDHGVGRFGGLVRTSVNGHPQEMIKLTYLNDDIIFVSIHALHKLAKYRGREGVPPKVNRLGSGAWNRVKENTKRRLKDIARDLIALYAERRQAQGHAFSPDSYLQHELEASFVYEDTPDQLTATQAVKADMEAPRPMDRLICGDVGFGKTEVAIRAAFKAAVDGRQTAVLVPTTVLAFQHFRTFTERLKDFPVRVEYLSRARTPRQVKEILADLEAGKIDILIGTHKIIGRQVRFHDLGLLVVDEEQKFGVAVKERLRQLKANVDTLTMSATPIPRTLQFSLMGARDLSSINTPPPNRYPILTSVNAMDDDMMREAINFELSRGGQVFIINNRIEGLGRLEEMVRRLVPDARMVVAHGQMPPDRLEKAILDFAAHDYDILMSTTIVESGVDMPNVNTIIINDAQNFGLSELHQLRGRVGRSNRKAFCYLLVPPQVPLTPVARRRLQAIESFSDLGSGIHIAMQDLDIRGAGNLLGAEQSGFIADLGYETYQKILREAVTELRTQELAPAAPTGKAPEEEEFVTDTVIESDLEVLFPARYVPQENERIALYQELDSMDTDRDLEGFRARLQDRFGTPPPQALELMRIPVLRRMARRLGLEKVALKGGVMYIYFVGDDNEAYYQSPMFGRALQYLQLHARRVKIRQGARRSFSISAVPSVEAAVSVLSEMLLLPPAG